MSGHIRTLIVAASLGIAALTVSCERSETPRGGSTHAPGDHRPGNDRSTSSLAEDGTPIDVVSRVHEYRLAGRLSHIAEHLVSEQRAQVIELIQAVDRLLGGNQVLQASVTRHFGPASAKAFDRSQAANAIGVFSSDLEIIDQRIDGEVAYVGIQIARRVPLDDVKLVRREGRWLIQTDAPIAGLADELCRLADALIDTAGMLDKRAMTLIEFKKELGLREASIGRRITALTNTTPP